jgi:putative CocE/NonD family hydrolase
MGPFSFPGRRPRLAARLARRVGAAAGGLALVMCVGYPSLAQAAPVEQTGYITMSDGVKLRYAVELPASTGRFPVALKYDGYCEGTDPMGCNGTSDSSALLNAGFAILGVNLRGTGCSQGQFDFRSPQESQDGAAVVQWAADQPWSTGHVGMFGDSFPGLTQPGVAALRPAGLDAIAPFQLVDDVYRDVGYPGGISNSEFGAFWGLGDEPAASNQSVAQGAEGGDSQCVESEPGRATVNPPSNIVVAGLQHPYFDSFWSSKAVGSAASNISVPTFACQTWQDDEVGSRSTWTLWPRLDPTRTWVVAANGYHSMCIESTSIISELVRFFERFVKGVPNGFEATPHMQIWHDTAGTTDAEPAWVTASVTWPPATSTHRLYLGDGAALRAAAPSGAEPVDSYVSPTVSAGTEDGVVFGQHNELWKLPGTPDGALVYTTPRLAHDVELLGPASVDLWLKATAPDTNLQATITDVRPDGQEVYVARGWLRASMRTLDRSASTPTFPVQTDLRSDVKPLVPAAPTFLRFAVYPFDYVFRAGSRIRLIIDSPSQTGGWNFEPVANTPGLTPTSTLADTGVNSILHDAAHPSRLVIGTVSGASAQAGYPACDTLLNQPCRPDASTASDPPGQLNWP